MLLIDVVTFVHLAAVAAGLGAAIFTDSLLFLRLAHTMRPRHLAVIHHAHGVIALAIVVLWITGLALIALKAGFDPANWSPKLFAKLGTVFVLTITAIAMAKIALPHMAENVGKRLLDTPIQDRCTLALCAAMSAAGWLTALMLGSSKILKTAGDEVLLITFGIHGIAVGCALAAVFILDVFQSDQ